MPLTDWLRHRKQQRDGKEADKRTVPGGIWSKCANCGKTIYQNDILENQHVCPECDHHFSPSPHERVEALLDADSFRPMDEGLTPQDPLSFIGSKPYKDSLKKAMSTTGSHEAVLTGAGRITNRPVCLGVMDFRFIAGSMGSVVGEKITRLFETATTNKAPVITVSSSGGARMQEGMLSLLQMAKTTGALERHNQANLPYISILTNPTTGGVLASFASLGDIIIAEPRALIGFAGPRVIEQTLGEELPPGFQRAESVLELGTIDMIVHRRDLRKTIASLLDYLAPVQDSTETSYEPGAGAAGE